MTLLLAIQIALLLVTALTVFSLGLTIWLLAKRGIAALRRRRG